MSRESSGEALVVVQIRGVIEQIVSTLIHILPIVGRQLSSGGATWLFSPAAKPHQVRR